MLQSLKTNKQKLLALASGQDVSWDGGSGGVQRPRPKTKVCPTLSGNTTTTKAGYLFFNLILLKNVNNQRFLFNVETLLLLMNNNNIWLLTSTL
jgi:hypothetical protein